MKCKHNWRYLRSIEISKVNLEYWLLGITVKQDIYYCTKCLKNKGVE